MIEIFEALGIIYLVTLWLILFSANRKNIQNLKQKVMMWSDIFRWNFKDLELLCYIILD